MKKIIVVVLALAMLLSFAACAAEEEEVVEEEVNTQVANPWADSSAEEISDKLGVDFAAPEAATDVYYSWNESICLGSVNFTLDGAEWTARAEKAEEFRDISGYYIDWDSEEDYELGGMTGKFYSGSDDENAYIGMAQFFDSENGIMYSIVYTSDEAEDVSIAAKVFNFLS